MKSIAVFLLAFLNQTLLSAQDTGLHLFTLTGTIEGLDSGFVYINYIPNGEGGITDSSKLIHGHFVLKGKVTEPTKAWFWGPQDEENTTQFYIEPGELQLYGKHNHLKNLQLTGSESDKDRIKLEKLEKQINADLESGEDYLIKCENEYKTEKRNTKDSFRLKSVKQKIDSIRANQEKYYRVKAHIDSSFIIENPNSYVAADMVANSGVSWIAFPSLDSLYQKFPVYIQQSFPGKRIKFEIDREAAIPINSDAKPFTAIDSKGDTIKLKDYKTKKYVLLDFGASWCKPCRAIIPVLKKEYSKYDSAFEIISIANQEEEEDWRKAIKDDKMAWPQIIENKYKRPLEPVNGSISDMYYVSTIPSLILLDKNLKIIGKYGGFYYSNNTYMLDLQQKLNEIFH